MSINRASFLKIAASGGLGMLFGGVPMKSSWRDGGVTLCSVERNSLVMGSVAQFQVVAETEDDGYEAIRRGVDIFRDLDRKLSMYDANSEMGRLAAAAGKTQVTLSKDALNVLQYAKKMWQQTGGKFDVTIDPAMQRWGFRKDPEAQVMPPTDQQLQTLVQLIGSEKLHISDRGVYLQNRGMAVDLGGIAGGYALDKAMEVMKQADIAAAFINFSGDIHCFGDPLQGSGWPVHIYNPQTQQPLAQPVVLRNQALSTSGAYQNRRGQDQEHSWGHLFLPDQARPVKSNGSQTAIHASAMAADAWSTSAFVGATIRDDVRIITI